MNSTAVVHNETNIFMYHVIKLSSYNVSLIVGESCGQFSIYTLQKKKCMKSF